MAYKRILVALDLSEEANDVLEAAKNQAELQGNAELHLISVVKPITHAFGGFDAGVTGATVNLESDLRKHTEQTISAWAKDLGLSTGATHVKTGNPASEIRATAEEIEADLIIIGTHGRHGLGLLLGSTANGVLHGTTCDVLTIRIQ